MIRISEEKAMALHSLMTLAMGGDDGVRDKELLNSALEAAFATFDGTELYPTTEEKGARLGHSLIANHAFVDGNKRIGMFVMMIFLELNGVQIRPEVDDVARVGISVAAGDMGYDELLEWIRRNRC